VNWFEWASAFRDAARSVGLTKSAPSMILVGSDSSPKREVIGRLACYPRWGLLCDK
jgi:hypothetical protein